MCLRPRARNPPAMQATKRRLPGVSVNEGERAALQASGRIRVVTANADEGKQCGSNARPAARSIAVLLPCLLLAHCQTCANQQHSHAVQAHTSGLSAGPAIKRDPIQEVRLSHQLHAHSAPPRLRCFPTLRRRWGPWRAFPEGWSTAPCPPPASRWHPWLAPVR